MSSLGSSGNRPPRATPRPQRRVIQAPQVAQIPRAVRQPSAEDSSPTGANRRYTPAQIRRHRRIVGGGAIFAVGAVLTAGVFALRGGGESGAPAATVAPVETTVTVPQPELVLLNSDDATYALVLGKGVKLFAGYTGSAATEVQTDHISVVKQPNKRTLKDDSEWIEFDSNNQLKGVHGKVGLPLSEVDGIHAGIVPRMTRTFDDPTNGRKVLVGPDTLSGEAGELFEYPNLIAANTDFAEAAYVLPLPAKPAG